ncbi:MAG: alpha-amylase family glycosyl hydrolase, partial [Saprospiraceae bacterium]
AGTFNGWNGSGRFQDDDGDGRYELTVNGFQAGDNIAYKFRLNGEWSGREEFPGVGNDRMYTVGSESETLFHWYNNETPPNAELVADFNGSLREFYEQGVITYSDRSSGQADAWEWVFEGGTPNVSTQKNPVVRYDTPGKYSVRLRVSQGEKTNTVVFDEYVNVLARNTTDIPWWNETVFYEIFVRSFKDSDNDGIGDFKGLTEKLDYLNDGDPTTTDDLGITGIWLMPIHESGSYHGYDVIDYRSVKELYGGMDDFKEFLDEAHKRGIKVIIDWVINHNSSQSTWFQNAVTGPNSEFRDFYRWSATDPGYSGPWGQQVWHRRNNNYYYGLFWDGMPDLNLENPKVKEEIFNAADFWLEEVGIDGFRLDAVKFMIEEGQKLEDTQSTYTFWKDFTASVKAANPEAFSVGEAWTNTETAVNYVKDDRIDYCFEFDLAGNIMYSANEGKAENMYQQMQKMYNIYPHLQYGTFLANHDQNRIMNSFDNDESKVKLAAAMYLTLPGIPYIYYGEEIGMVGEKPDEFIRRPMQWNGDRNAGFSEANPWISVHGGYPRFNVEREAGDPSSLLTTYKKLIQLRNKLKPLQVGTYEPVTTNNSRVFAFVRQHEGQDVLVIHNTTTSVIRNLTLDFGNANIPTGSQYLFDRLTEEAPLAINLINNKVSIDLTLGGRGTKVYELGQTVSTEYIDKQSYVKLFPNPVDDLLTVEIKNLDWQETDYTINDVQGRVVATGKIDLRNQLATISTGALPAGMYQLVLKNAEIVQQISFVKGE